MTSVIGYLTLLRDEPQISQELRARYTGIALDKAERLEELVNEFFDITRFNLTTLALEPERINLSRMLEQIASEFLPILAEKELRWRLDIQPGVEIVGDPDKLERVLDNLIRNAVNYSYAQTEIALSLIRWRIVCRSRCATAAKPFRPISWSGCSSSFSGWIPPVPPPPAGRAWAWPSPRRSWNGTAAASRPRARTKAFSSRCFSRWIVRKSYEFKEKTASSFQGKAKTTNSLF